MMKKFILIAILGIVLSACSTIHQHPTATPTPIFPTVTPFPTITSFDVITKYPEDRFLFVNAYSGEECTAGCCIVYEALPAQFLFKDGKLYIVGPFFEPPIENWGETRKTNNAIGLYYFDTARDVGFAFIDSIPYESKYSEFIINGVDQQGNISVKTKYGNVSLSPGANVARDWVEQGSGSCQIHHFAGITNYGFINDSQVAIVSYVDDFP
jgi:hypothetical protein